MATNQEMSFFQKYHLQELLELKKICAERKFDIPELQKAITKAATLMSAEDVAYVEKMTGVKTV